jgi:Superinfection immunity protein
MTAAAFLFIAFALMLYSLPAITAVKRGVEHMVPIAGLNLVFGWTLAGWVGALVWACYSRPRPKPSDAEEYVVVLDTSTATSRAARSAAAHAQSDWTRLSPLGAWD